MQNYLISFSHRHGIDNVTINDSIQELFPIQDNNDVQDLQNYIEVHNGYIDVKIIVITKLG